MECVHENVGTNQINAYMSWNIANQKANKRPTVSKKNTILKLRSTVRSQGAGLKLSPNMRIS